MLKFTTFELLILSSQLRDRLRLYIERANHDVSGDNVSAPGAMRDLRSLEALVLKVEAELTLRDQNTAFQDAKSKEKEKHIYQDASVHSEIFQPDLDEIQKEE